jgi:hypothetical protein
LSPIRPIQIEDSHENVPDISNDKSIVDDISNGSQNLGQILTVEEEKKEKFLDQDEESKKELSEEDNGDQRSGIEVDSNLNTEKSNNSNPNDTQGSERFDSEADETQASEGFDSNTNEDVASQSQNNDLDVTQINKVKPVEKQGEHIETSTNVCVLNSKDYMEQRYSEFCETDAFKEIAKCEKLLHDDLISNPEPEYNCEKVTVNQRHNKEVYLKDLHIKMLECNMETLIGQIHQLILDKKEMEISKNKLEEKTKVSYVMLTGP